MNYYAILTIVFLSIAFILLIIGIELCDKAKNLTINILIIFALFAFFFSLLSINNYQLLAAKRDIAELSSVEHSYQLKYSSGRTYFYYCDDCGKVYTSKILIGDINSKVD